MADFKGVLVGINKYKDYPLKGCVNDVAITRDILIKKYQVQPHQIRTIVDARATKDEILERLEWLISQSYTTKNLFFHYSGHGAQLPNQNYEDDQEIDGMDEIICPVDFNWKTQFIKDDDIGKIISKKNPECRLVMIFDCCHSGTAYRTVGGFTPDPVKLASKYITPRVIETPIDLLARTNMIISPFVTKVSGQNEELWGFDDKDIEVLTDRAVPINPRQSFLTENSIFVSGCRDNQTSADAFFGNRYQGALSYCLQKYMYYHPQDSLNDTIQNAVKYIKQFGFEQDPVLTVADKTDISTFVKM